jgi:putative PIG3 family NAD(P)H quinone oxidoreductase
MTAIDPAESGGPEVLVAVERPVPRPGAGEVLIKVAAAGVNRPDVLQRKGAYPPPPGAPSIPGLEVAGEIVAVGEGVDMAQIGQMVCALVAGGGYAEYAVAPAGQCLPVPDALTLEEAAAMPETLFTVWTNLFERAWVAEGDSVLVHGGTSGIGTMAIKLCNLFGLTIIVTAGSDEKCAKAKALGADHAINYNRQDFVEEVKAITGGAGITAVLDMVGGDYVPRNLACLAEDGRHVSIAVQRGAEATIPLATVMRRRLTLTGSTLRPRNAEFKALVADELARTVWPLVEEGRLKPEIDATFPLAQAAEAHRLMESGDHVGKIVLTMACGGRVSSPSPASPPPSASGCACGHRGHRSRWRSSIRRPGCAR